ncbi:MAG TPA: hypothetical protein VND94_15180 [Terriglobia bacterium]|nr:hypothetical protein [Terriglobia bacterium]
MSELTTIYMPLLNEAVDVWRPVMAEPLGRDRYKILGPIPDEEEWSFAPGAVVICAPRQLSGGFVLVAEEPVTM